MVPLMFLSKVGTKVINYVATGVHISFQSTAILLLLFVAVIKLPT